ncbi:MAG TPA: GlsB/YeaQ/YmgE family stress response membrane protein [Candidatus Dormibacteraeota bacterium]|nr:GlsB/YeaQ/YmgE family stress response membrane protein [Candidatus Dormibacteraeota bacterium]
MIDIRLDVDTVLIWILVGLVAGALASRVTLGHGLGLLGDLVTGVLGALLGGVLAQVFKINFTITGHPIITAMVVAFVGAVILLFVLRILGFGRKHD